MKTEIAKETYLISASPITCKYASGNYDAGEALNYFLVHPIIGRPFIGSKRTVGYVEVITGEKLCDTYYRSTEGYGPSYTPDYELQCDAVSRSKEVGDVHWQVNAVTPIERLVAPALLEQYYKKSPIEISAEIADVRERARTTVRTTDLQQALKRQ